MNVVVFVSGVCPGHYAKYGTAFKQLAGGKLARYCGLPWHVYLVQLR
jgi:hypothetical protein